MKIKKRLIITIFFSTSLVIFLSFGQVIFAQAPNASDLVERGVKDYNAGNFSTAIKHWQEALSQYKYNSSDTAVINENLARAYQELGKEKEAIESLLAAISNYNAVNNKKITISQLENSLRNINSKSDGVELLALTACNTAVGDDRTTLGLAGVALQVGVKSAIASLWNVEDKSISTLVKDFYTNYRNEGISIAQALQKAQVKMIEDKADVYDNPAYWAPMIVIGNWL
jgi:tetratricopeptide (TPR) repeat protein